MTPEQFITISIVVGVAQVFTALAVLVSDIVLAIQVNKLRVVVQNTRQDFDRVKHDIANIKDIASEYKGVVEGITKNGLSLKLKSERFGALELDLKKQEAKEEKP